MAILVLTHTEIEQLLPMQDCIDVMDQALAAFQRGDLHQPLRTIYMPPEATGLLGWMPAHRSGQNSIYGMKLISIVPENPKRGIDSHQGVVMLMDGLTGIPQALMNASAITAIRTAAVSAVATRLLARDDAHSLAIIGTGVQARRHLEAIPLVRQIERVRIAGRTPERARLFVQSVQSSFPFAIEAAENAESAVRDADIVVTATNSREPVLQHSWLAPGTHLNVIGASMRTHREIDTETLAAATYIVDSKESVINEAGEYWLALEQGAIQPSHIRAELGELLLNSMPARTSNEELTIFRSLGLAIEDICAAQFLLERARATGSGTTVQF
jgi:ornithine cyclodeaminase/alanine dehydrogenase-like protein (mu-crystallin family)